MKLTMPVKLLLAIAGAAVAYVLLAQFNLVPAAIRQRSAVPTQFTLPTDAPDAPSRPLPAGFAVSLPSTVPAARKGPPIKINVWAWNAMMGLIYANGGPVTTKGSLMESHGVGLQLIRQDDTEKTKPEQVKFAQAVAAGADTPADGVPFAIIMGDGAAQYLSATNKLLTKLGPDYRAEIVGAVGYSRGEDAWWGPPAWKDSAEAMKGGVTAGVLRDGDWNIAQFKLANDGIPNNPDERTWDPDAMNWFAADDYLKAVELYVAGACEDRPVVRAGKLTSEPKHRTCVEGVVTWTPGDVNLARKKGGLVRLLSTKENVYQMPAVVIGIHKWDVAHVRQGTALLAAAFDGCDQVKAYDAALSRAGAASAVVYGEQTAGYWTRYYKGVTEPDRTGVRVPLGGSTCMTLADNLVLFGLAPGVGGLDASLFKATYEGFGTIAKQQYPKLVPDFPRTAQAVNTAFVEALGAKTGFNADAADVATFVPGASIAKEDVVARRNWTVTFDTGKATFTPEAVATLGQLYDQLVVGGGLAVEIDGHTDNVGSPTANQALSVARAAAVQQWLERRAPTLFPAGRIEAHGFGQSEPVASNATADGRAKNRRVTIVLGTKG